MIKAAMPPTSATQTTVNRTSQRITGISALSRQASGLFQRNELS
jgi:hypothetical protein